MTGAVDEAHGAISSRRLLGEHAQDAMEAAEPVADAVKSTSELLQPVLEKVEVFTILVETIGDIHPYAKIASTVLLAGVKVVINQDKRDKAIDGLLEAMDNIYNFANRALQLGDIDKDRKKLLKDMTLQTTQCAYFIRDQAQVKNFCKHIS
ncbi:hypothetical protein BD310DRAFT_825821 [Dichomitus squalens]|uniref:Fungal STAND N-terminal Goodbye domain-containing protein n=1 Tax=Dichomitus squalens TaxID=114155 RepID=A0A4Q9PMG7_9APHY|nr:hypothetical protein BD310DRAFT_825821 [Dichomitus squalens]